MECGAIAPLWTRPPARPPEASGVREPCGGRIATAVARPRIQSAADRGALQSLRPPQERCTECTLRSRPMDQVLNGIRILEVAQWWFVPAAGAVLADWGADVLKVEHPI